MRILIVEDEAGIVAFLKQGLQEEGFDVLAAHTGTEGFALALEKQPDLILMDWMLPEMSGLEVCKALRKDYDIPIIFLTARDTIPETIEGLRAGANDYIKKPFSFEELLERIKVQLRHKVAREPDLQVGTIVLSVARHKVFKDGREVILTQREFELLTYLIRHMNQVCTRNQIINDVWHIRFDYDTGVIDVFINAIRKKLGLDKEDDFIRTIRGVGYMAEL